MTKAIYIGVSSKARKVKKIYVGVSNKARLVKKGYIGVGGKARLFFSNESPIIRNGNGTALTNTVNQLSSASNFGSGTYCSACFTGGFKNSTTLCVNTVDRINEKLVKSSSTISRLSANMASAILGNTKYCLFAGGNQSSSVDVLNERYVLSNTTVVNNTGASFMGGASVGQFCHFAGGLNGTSTYLKSITEYSATNLVRTEAGDLSIARYGMISISSKDMKRDMFIGGQNASNSTSNAVDSFLYNKNRLTLSSATNGLNTAFGAGGVAGNYFIAAGGYIGNGSSVSNKCYAYNNSLVQTSCDPLQKARCYLACTSLDSYVIFAGGSTSKTVKSNSTAYVDIYSSSLVHSVGTNLGTARAQLGAATIGNYAIFAGGCTTSETVATNVTDIYKLG